MNDHRPACSQVCGIKPECAAQLNRILIAVPDVAIVISSAWRYLLNTVPLAEFVMQTHGIESFKRVHGMTGADEDFLPSVAIDPQDPTYWDYLKQCGHDVRARQIQSYAAAHGVTRFVVLDDLPIPLPQLIQTDGGIGLTAEIADKVIAALR